MSGRNIPYVKTYDENGVCTNPITMYLSPYPNRQQREKELHPTRHMGNNKGVNLTVGPSMKLKRVRQFIQVRDPKTHKFTGEVRRIEHYLT